jgi:hypothetical protein
MDPSSTREAPIDGKRSLTNDQRVIGIAVILLVVAHVVRLASRGGPYLDRPPTIVEHVGPAKHDTRDALVLLPKVAPLIPRGAVVTCFRPAMGQEHSDDPDFFAAVGALPKHQVWPSFLASRDTKRKDLAEYVVAVEKPFDHPYYHLVATFPEGRLYKVDR